MPDELIPFFIDECVADAVAKGLRDCGHNAIHAVEAGRGGCSDPEQLEYATAKGLSLVTYNVADFSALHKEWEILGRTHAGIFLAEDRRYQRNPFGLINDLRATLRYYTDAYAGETDWRLGQIFGVQRQKG